MLLVRTPGRKRRPWSLVPSRCWTRVGPSTSPITGIFATTILLFLNIFINLRTSVQHLTRSSGPPRLIIWSTCRSHPVRNQSSLQPLIPSLMWRMAHSTASRAQTSQLTSCRCLETFPDRLLQDAPCPQHSLLCAWHCSTTTHDHVKTSTLRRV